MRGIAYKGQTVVPTGELQQLRTPIDVVRKRAKPFRTEGLRARPILHCAESINRKLPELQTLVADRNASIFNSARRRVHLATLASIFGHLSVLSIILLSVSHHVPKSKLIPIAIKSSGEEENHRSQFALTSVNSQGKLSLDLSQDVEIAQTAPSASDPSATDQAAHSVPEDLLSTSAGSQESNENHLWNANASSAHSGGGLIDLTEQDATASPELKVVSKTDWQGNPVEAKSLTYSVPGSGLRVTVREASSAGFLGVDFAPGFGPADADTSGPFPTAWDDNAAAKSQKVDGTLVNLKHFGLTAFGYRSEVGYDFRSFGRNMSESPGTSTTKFGGET